MGSGDMTGEVCRGSGRVAGEGWDEERRDSWGVVRRWGCGTLGEPLVSLKGEGMALGGSSCARGREGAGKGEVRVSWCWHRSQGHGAKPSRGGKDPAGDSWPCHRQVLGFDPPPACRGRSSDLCPLWACQGVRGGQWQRAGVPVRVREVAQASRPAYASTGFGPWHGDRP